MSQTSSSRRVTGESEFSNRESPAVADLGPLRTGDESQLPKFTDSSGTLRDVVRSPWLY